MKQHMKQFLIQENDSGQRLDRFLQKAMPELPKSMFYKAIRTKNIKVNRKRCTPEQLLVAGDQIDCYLKDDKLPASVRPAEQKMEFLQAPDALDILYEDDQVLFICKPVGLVVHCDNRQTPDTLIHRVLHYLYRTGAYHPEQEQSFTPALCNRLDRNTGGIVVAAKTAAALREVNRLIRENRIHKTYLCITVGTPKPPTGVLHAWHKKSLTHNIVTIRDTQAEGFQEIITGYRVLTSNARHALVAVDLITGRTHQIRAHLAHIGTPILGDNKYGNGKENRALHCPYQQLWAYSLTLHPDKSSCLAGLNGLTVQTALPEFVVREFPAIQEDFSAASPNSR